jgi:iron(III) transport system permease protein
VAIPLIMLLMGSLKTTPPDVPSAISFVNYVNAFTAPFTYKLLFNSLSFAIGSSVIAFCIGATFAWLVARTNVPLKNLAYALVLVPLMMPSILFAISWNYLLAPRVGIFNIIAVNLFHLSEPPFNLYSLYGMMWIEGLLATPLVFTILTPAFRGLDPAMEEAAAISGASTVSIFRRITLRLILPALLASLLMVLIRAIEAFEVPVVLGIPAGIVVFSTQIYLALKATIPRDFGLASSLAVIMVLLSVFGIWLYNHLTRRAEQFTTITGKGYRPTTIDLGRWRYAASSIFIIYFLLTVGFPLIVLFWGSLLPYYSPPSLDRIPDISWDNYHDIFTYPELRKAVGNSIFLATWSAILATLLGAIISWIVIRSRLPGRRVLDMLAFTPYAIPGIVVGLALMYVYLILPLPVYATIWILLISYTTKYLPYGLRATNTALLQIHRELEEVAYISGASWIQTFVKVMVPLLLPAFIANWLFVFMISVREMSSSILLYTPKSAVLSIMVLDLWNAGDSCSLCALGVVITIGMSAIIFFSRRLGAHFGMREQRAH